MEDSCARIVVREFGVGLSGGFDDRRLKRGRGEIETYRDSAKAGSGRTRSRETRHGDLEACRIAESSLFLVT
jgi:hypothetical protein